jgi:hypothetical protein
MGTCTEGLCIAAAGVEVGNPVAGTGAFGAAVATNGRTVVGAFRDHVAYLVEPTGETFAVKQGLDSIFGEAGSQFGAAVAIEGDVIAIGAPRSTGPGAPADGAGAVVVFERDPAQDRWFESAQILGPDGGEFGAAVVLSSTRLFVGAPRARGSGAVYIYERTGPGTWMPTDRLDGDASGDRFGHAIAAQGERLAVGAPFGMTPLDNPDGYVRIYDHSSAGWAGVARVVGSDSTLRAQRFGATVGVDGDHLAVGAPGTQGPDGVVSFFARGTGTWDRASFTGSPEGAVAAFATGVSLDTGRAIVTQVDSAGRGTTFVARRQPGGSWLFVGRIDDAAADQPGVEVGGVTVNATLAVSSTIAVVGYPGRGGAGAIVFRDVAGM